ncbi:Fc.00g054710.m01.CDS01 [Cosmosporella sp. VM-42]
MSEPSPQSQPLVASPVAMSDGIPSPVQGNFNINATGTLPNGSSTLKRKFGTVEAAPPTAAKKRIATFVEGDYSGNHAETTGQKFKRLVKKAMDNYNYADCSLLKDNIRLLFLKPSEDPNAFIVVELRRFHIEELAQNHKDYQFTALSYNWGDGGETETVLVDMQADTAPAPTVKDLTEVITTFKKRMRPLHVKPNLYAFLRQFRQRDKEVALWVDRVCINQQSNEEKQDQVSRMNMIYSTASNVSIWLGPPDEDMKTDRAMDFISLILQDDSEGKFTDKYATNWSELLYLMRRRWFSRRWIIQELALARNAEVRCGSKRRNWRDFSDAVSIFALHFDKILKIIKRRPDLKKSLEGIKDMKPFGARILVDVLSNTFQRHADGTIFSPRQGLESLISSLSTFETSDPRDTVYTLLNLAKETLQLPSNNVVLNQRRQKRINENPPPVPDYTMDLLEVYTKFVKWCVKESGSLDILCRHWALPEIDHKLDDFYPRLVVLPSWIKTVRDSAYGAQTEGFGGRKTGDSFVGTPDSRCYDASLGMKPNVTFGRDRGAQTSANRNSIDKAAISHRQRLISRSKINRVPRAQQDLSRSITVKGYCIGRITDRYQMLEGIIPKQVLRKLGHVSDSMELEGVSDAMWRSLVADRGPDGKAPPAWYRRACMTCLVADTNFGNLDTNSILKQDDTTNLKSDYLKRVQAVCWNRTFFEWENGDEKKLEGIGPGESDRDDLVCILYGCSVPCILRQTWYGSDPNYYQLIGEAFILGHMDGEAIMDLSEEELESGGEMFSLI